MFTFDSVKNPYADLNMSSYYEEISKYERMTPFFKSLYNQLNLKYHLNDSDILPIKNVFPTRAYAQLSIKF